MRRAAALAAILAIGRADVAPAQRPTAVHGVVRDSRSARPLIGAVVTLLAPTGARTTRSDDVGAFSFARVDTGRYTLEIRHLGYEPSRRVIDFPGDTATIGISLVRIASLDTVRIRGADQAIYGVVATAHDLQPLRGATVQIIGASGARVETDSTAHFFLSLRTPGVYVVRARVPGYDAQTMSVTVPRNEGVEVALLLDSATSGANHRFELAFADFETRGHYRALNRSAIVPARELATNARSRLVDAVRVAQSFGEKVLRFSDTACVFVDGLPRPGISPNAFDVDQVMAVETYAEKIGPPPRLPASDGSGMLETQWPKHAACGDTGLPRTAPGEEVILWIVIWLKH